MGNNRRLRLGGSSLSGSELKNAPVRPPAIPDKTQHQINLGACDLRPEALANWLGVSLGDIKKGDNILVRLAVAHYMQHRARVILARVDKA